MFTTNGKNQLLGATDIAYASMHSGFPGEAGANEISGGTPAYARKAITLAAASGGARATSGAVTFDIPVGATLRWVGFQDAVSAGNCRACSPNGGSPKKFQVDLTNNRILCEAHGYAADQKIVFFGGTPPTGLTEGTIYFVRTPTSADPDHFEVAATAGGAAIDITGQPAAGCMVSVIVEEGPYGAQGQFILNAGTSIGLNI